MSFFDQLALPIYLLINLIDDRQNKKYVFCPFLSLCCFYRFDPKDLNLLGIDYMLYDNMLR